MTRKPLNLWQGIVLLVVGCGVGYPAYAALGHCMWGGGCSNPKLVMAGVFVGGLSFISGVIALLVVAIKRVTISPRRVDRP